jgi:hypothetical protein
VYGEQWIPCVQPLQIMSIAGILLSIEPIAVSAITARGYVGFEAMRQLIYMVVLVLGVFVGSYWGIRGVSVAVVVAAIALAMLLQGLLRKIVTISLSEFIEAVKPVIWACAVMSLVLFLCQEFIEPLFVGYRAPLLAVVLIGGSSAYAATLFLLWSRSASRDDVERMKSHCGEAYELIRGLLRAGLFSRT